LNNKFHNKTTLITGAGSGIGQACAELFAKAGSRIAVVDISEAQTASVVEAISKAGGEAIGIKCDVSSTTDVDAMVEQIQRKWGGVDIAINNAGITAPPTEFAETKEADFDRTIAVNLKGVWACMRAELRDMHLRKQGIIINMASALSMHGFSGSSIYVASKHAIAGLTKTAAIEYAKSGIRINAVCPGVILTPILEKVKSDPEVIAGMSANHPMGRLGTPAEVADAALWLASESASFVTGSMLSVDGGWSAL
jgi:NAD(P)-dependent dehydrogenase (short-subunit alcohol dehydrogenase family)